jgi:hypothetical protein
MTFLEALIIDIKESCILTERHNRSKKHTESLRFAKDVWELRKNKI